ncbi:MAG TPA: ribonuclease H family protein [Tissierellaceae bacterium]
MKNKYYAVRKGKTPGIYFTWDDCKKQVTGFKGAEYKKFESLSEAETFISGKKEDVVFLETQDHIDSLKDEEIIAYVDGSFNLKEFSYSYGVVLIDKNKIIELNGIGEDDDLKEMRNVSGELNGAIVAIEEAIKLGKKKIYLHYDYAGIEKWAVGDWKRNKKGTQKYKEFIDNNKEKIEIEFIKVPAHEGIKYNELADELAKAAFEKKE